MASPAGTPIPLAAFDGAPKSFPTGGHQPPAASTAGVPLPSDTGTPADENASAYASAIARRSMHSVGAPAAGPKGNGMPTVGPISK